MCTYTLLKFCSFPTYDYLHILEKKRKREKARTSCEDPIVSAFEGHKQKREIWHNKVFTSLKYCFAM